MPINSDVLSSVTGDLGESVLGPEYNYHDQIKSPTELGVSSAPNLFALGNDVKALKGYIELLIDGGGNAKKYKNRDLGDKFFLRTTAKCKDVETKEMVTRFFYIDNQIKGNLPFAGDTGLKGLLPGVIEGILQISPGNLIKGFAEGGEPWCKEISKEVILDNGATVNTEKRHVVLTDLDESDLSESDKKLINKSNECLADGKSDCDNFSNMNYSNMHKNVKLSSIPNTYVLTVSIFFIFILYKFMIRK